MLCNHHHGLIPEHFHPPKINPIPIFICNDFTQTFSVDLSVAHAGILRWLAGVNL